MIFLVPLFKCSVLCSMETGVERFVDEFGGICESDSAYCSHQSNVSITTANHNQTSKGGSLGLLGLWMVNNEYFF